MLFPPIAMSLEISQIREKSSIIDELVSQGFFDEDEKKRLRGKGLIE
jgi:hypothetical protein